MENSLKARIVGAIDVSFHLCPHSEDSVGALTANEGSVSPSTSCHAMPMPHDEMFENIQQTQRCHYMFYGQTTSGIFGVIRTPLS